MAETSRTPTLKLVFVSHINSAVGSSLNLGVFAKLAYIRAAAGLGSLSAGTGEILGAHLIGPQVTELLPELTLAANAELTIEEIARNVHAHLSLSEVVMEAAHGLAGGYIHA